MKTNHKLLLCIILLMISCVTVKNNMELPDGIYKNEKYPQEEICVRKNKIYIKMNFEGSLKENNRFIDKSYKYKIEYDGRIYLYPAISTEPIIS